MVANRVLIVDPSAETREVLRTALERSGTEILEATSANQGLTIARFSQPDVIVVDVECEAASCQTVTQDFREAASGCPAAMIVIGTARQAKQSAAEGSQPHEFVRKPYHYAPLIHKIEQLLAEHEQPRFQRAA